MGIIVCGQIVVFTPFNQSLTKSHLRNGSDNLSLCSPYDRYAIQLVL